MCRRRLKLKLSNEEVLQDAKLVKVKEEVKEEEKKPGKLIRVWKEEWIRIEGEDEAR